MWAKPKSLRNVVTTLLARNYQKRLGRQKGRLVDEIKQIEDKISPESLKEINLIRNMGNIGAHMEKDVNLVIDIDPGEARLLIELIESLIKEWYIDKHERKKRTAALEEKIKKANIN